MYDYLICKDRLLEDALMDVKRRKEDEREKGIWIYIVHVIYFLFHDGSLSFDSAISTTRKRKSLGWKRGQKRTQQGITASFCFKSIYVSIVYSLYVGIASFTRSFGSIIWTRR